MLEQAADERAFAEPVGPGERDAAGAADFELGETQVASAAAQRQLAGRQAQQKIPRHEGRAVHPDAGLVAFPHRDLGAPGRDLAGALVHLRDHLAGVGVLAAHLGEIALGAAVVVVGRDLDLFGASRGGGFLVGDDAAALGLVLEAGLGAAQRLVGGAGGGLLVFLLLHRGGDAAGAEHGVGRIDDEALRAEFVQQGAIMAHEQADAGELGERANEQAARVGVDVVARLVEGEHGGFAPEGDRDLGAFALAVAERGPALGPVVADAQAGLEHGGVGRPDKILEKLWRLVGALRDVERQALPVHRAALGGEFAGDDLEQGGLARAVGPDHAGPSRGELHGEIGEERRGHPGMRKLDCLEGQLGGGHARHGGAVLASGNAKRDGRPCVRRVGG